MISRQALQMGNPEFRTVAFDRETRRLIEAERDRIRDFEQKFNDFQSRQGRRQASSAAHLEQPM